MLFFDSYVLYSLLFFSADTGKFDFTVNWDNHFINKVHEDGKFLNRILPYPIQFEAIEDDGVLSSKK